MFVDFLLVGFDVGAMRSHATDDQQGVHEHQPADRHLLVLGRRQIADRLLVFVDFLLVGIGFWGMGHAGNPGAYVEAAFVNQLGCRSGAADDAGVVTSSRGLAYEIRGRGNGMWQASFAIGQFGSGMLLTFLGKQLGGLLPAFSALSMVCLAVAAAARAAALLGGKGARLAASV